MATAPSVRAVAAATAGATASPYSLTMPTCSAGDLLIAVFEYATGATGNHLSATGWTELAWGSATAPTGRHDLAVWGKIADGTESGGTVAFTVAGTTNHISGRSMSIQSHGARTTTPGSDILVGTGAGGNMSGAPPDTITIPGTTLTGCVPNSLVVMVGGQSMDVSSTVLWASWANANLSSITERMDNSVISGNGGGYGAATGVFAAGGTLGDSTVACSAAATERWSVVQIVIPPITPTLAVLDPNNPIKHWLRR